MPIRDEVAAAREIFFVLATLAILLIPGHDHARGATVFDIDVTRTSPDPEAPTFSGSGTISLDGTGSGAVITSLSLEIITLGALFDDSGAQVPLIHHFSYGLGDIVDVIDLVVSGFTLSGTVQFGPKPASSTGAVTIGGFDFGGLRLDFSTGIADGFCFSSALPTAECIRGGGSSTSIQAQLSTTHVPLPETVSLLLAALLALGSVGLRRHPRAATA